MLLQHHSAPSSALSHPVPAAMESLPHTLLPNSMSLPGIYIHLINSEGICGIQGTTLPKCPVNVIPALKINGHNRPKQPNVSQDSDKNQIKYSLVRKNNLSKYNLAFTINTPNLANSDLYIPSQNSSDKKLLNPVCHNHLHQE